MRNRYAAVMPAGYQSPELVAISALALSRTIRQRQASCREVMVAYLDHIEAVNPTVNAIVSLQDRDDLLAQAGVRDAELDRGEYRGWMHGFPQAVKDLSATRDITTTLGSPLLRDWQPDFDAVFVERLKRAGAIIIGKTNTPEFGLGSQTYNSVFGATRNAYDHDLCAGGSSGGAAVALATAMLPVADGSDMMGSLRNPAAFNNVIGFRPSHGRVPSAPRDEVFVQQLGYEGPMGRNVADTAALLSTMAGWDARSPLSIAEPVVDFAARLPRDVRGWRVAWLGDFNGYLPMQSGVLDLCEAGLERFEDIGVTVEAPALDYPMEELWQAWVTLRNWLVAGGLHPAYADKAKRKQMKPEALWEIESGSKLSALDVYNASKTRTRWYLALNDLFERYDFVALPSAQVFPFDVNTHWPQQIGDTTMDTYHRWMEVVIPGTLSGGPVVNVPAGFDPQGRPMGMQLIGPTHQDLKTLQLAYAYEQACG